jgi:hypothetical protein
VVGKGIGSRTDPKKACKAQQREAGNRNVFGWLGNGSLRRAGERWTQSAGFSRECWQTVTGAAMLVDAKSVLGGVKGTSGSLGGHVQAVHAGWSRKVTNRER